MAFAHRIGLGLVTLLGWARSAQACPGCKEALFDPEQLPQKLSTAMGYALSIGLMLLVPAGLVTAVTVSIVRAQRRQRARRVVH